jgi:hypothetical protein
MCALGYFAIRPLVKVLYLPEAIVSVFVIMFCLYGAYSEHNNLTDLWMIVVFGVVGYLFERYRFPIAPMVLGTILGPVAETAFQTSMISYGNDWTVFFTRPVSGAVMVLSATALLYPFYTRVKRKRALAVSGHELAVPRHRTPETVPARSTARVAVQAVVRTGDEIRHDSRRGAGQRRPDRARRGYPAHGLHRRNGRRRWDLMHAVAAGFPGRRAAALQRPPSGLRERHCAVWTRRAVEMLQASAWLRVDEATRVPLLGLVNGDDADELDAEVKRLLAEGFGTLKIKVGFDADEDARRVKRIQKAVAGRCRLRIDANV